MADQPDNTSGPPLLRWYRLTPDRVVVGLLILEGLLILSEWFGWFALNRHKGWTVLITVAAVGAVLSLTFLGFLVAVLFRRRFQFSIMSLLLLTLVVAVPLSWLAVERKRAREQRMAVEAIEKLGGWVGDNYEFDALTSSLVIREPPGPFSLSGRLGEYFFTRVTEVNLDETLATDTDLERLEGLSQLQCLELGGAPVTDAGLDHLKGLAQLQWLTLSETKVTDAGLERLKGLTQLRRLYLDYTMATDAGLEHLEGMTQLQLLLLGDTQITDAGLRHLTGLTQLEELWLDGTRITDAGLECLRGLSKLQTLDLSRTQVTDAGLEHLEGLPQLRCLRLLRTQVRHAGAQRLQQVLPRCKIYR